jgi:hypothetical protein
MPTILQYRNDDGSITEIGPEHPDYARLLAESGYTPPVDPWARLKVIGMGLGSLAGGAAIFYSQYVSMRDSQKYYPKLEMMAGMLLTLGLVTLVLSLFPPEMTTRPQLGDSPTWQKNLFIGVAVIVSIVGIVASFKIHYGMLASLGYQ